MDRMVMELIGNRITGRSVPATEGTTFDNVDPATGQTIGPVARSGPADAAAAVAAAETAQPAWGSASPVARGAILHAVANAMEARAEEIATVAARETGKAHAHAMGEVGAAVLQARYWAGEGQRLAGSTLPSADPARRLMTVRRPVGVVALVLASNTPIANVAWKLFPALICGNGVVAKASEDAPGTADIMLRIAEEAGLPPGVANVLQGIGTEAGAALVADPRVAAISFTGSSATGLRIAEAGARRMAKVSLECGGKNPLLIFEDADLDRAVHWAAVSAFSNAGQRCSSASRIIVLDAVYDGVRDQLVAAAVAQKLGTGPGDDLGPVISARALERMLAVCGGVAAEGGRILCGGTPADRPGFWMMPTVVEGLGPAAEMSRTELFGPITQLFRARDEEEAVALANDCDYGLTSAIHTTDLDRALRLADRIEAGVVSLNAGTHGAEPHMPFGGVKLSGNGTREPGAEALDIYTDLKNILLTYKP
jgi:aldehyde dehydrogenase (NAD+)